MSVEAIQFLKLGLEGLQQFWAFFWHEDFYDELNPLVVALRDRSVEHVRDKYNVFLRARVERLIVDIHEALSKQSSAVPPELPCLKHTAGCVAFVREKIYKFITMRHDGGIDFWEPEPHLKFFCLDGKSAAASPLRLAGGVAGRGKRVTSSGYPADGGSPSMSVAGRSKQVCGSHLLTLLNFKHNGGVFVCRHGGRFTSAHRSLREVTKTEALSSLGFLSGVVRQRADTVVRSSRLGVFKA